MNPLLSQVLSIAFLSPILIVGLAHLAIAQVSAEEPQPTSTEIDSGTSEENTNPFGIPTVTPIPQNPWENRNEEIQQQNQDEETQLNDEYATPENVDEPGVADPSTPTLDEDPY